MEKVNKKIEDIENGLITVVMDNNTYEETKTIDHRRNYNSGFSGAFYKLKKFLKTIEKSEDLIHDKFYTFLKEDESKDELYWFKDVVIELNRIFKNKE